jgi:hypothetical protein
MGGHLRYSKGTATTATFHGAPRTILGGSGRSPTRSASEANHGRSFLSFPNRSFGTRKNEKNEKRIASFGNGIRIHLQMQAKNRILRTIHSVLVETADRFCLVISTLLYERET